MDDGSEGKYRGFVVGDDSNHMEAFGLVKVDVICDDFAQIRKILVTLLKLVDDAHVQEGEEERDSFVVKCQHPVFVASLQVC